jgi:hypothetical protein
LRTLDKAGVLNINEPKLDVLPNGGVTGCGVRLEYKLASGARLEFRSSWTLLKPLFFPRDKGKPINPDDWERFSYAFHFESAPMKIQFRIDLDSISSYHVHVLPNTAAHMPAHLFEPDTTDISPLTFVEIVAQYLSNGVYPLKRK